MCRVLCEDLADTATTVLFAETNRNHHQVFQYVLLVA